MRRIIFTILLLFTALSSVGAAGREQFTADLHKSKGIRCEGCHAKAQGKTFVPAEKCLSCHGPASALAQKTAGEANPHASPHWGPDMECTVCHRQHEKTVNWCGHCHKYDFRVP